MYEIVKALSVMISTHLHVSVPWEKMSWNRYVHFFQSTPYIMIETQVSLRIYGDLAQYVPQTVILKVEHKELKTARGFVSKYLCFLLASTYCRHFNI